MDTSWPRWASKKLQIEVESIELEMGIAEMTPTASGWDTDSISTMLNRLTVSNGPIQAKAIQKAIENGGELSRAEVYRLGGYEADRSLRGFTRPVNRVLREMEEASDLPEDAE